MVAHTMAKSDFNVSELNSTTQVEVAKIRSEGSKMRKSFFVSTLFKKNILRMLFEVYLFFLLSDAQADQILAEAEAYVSNTRAAVGIMQPFIHSVLMSSDVGDRRESWWLRMKRRLLPLGRRQRDFRQSHLSTSAPSNKTSLNSK